MLNLSYNRLRSVHDANYHLGNITTLVLSIASYIICFMMYGLDKGAQYGPTLFVLFLLKGLTWSPFTGMELYDTLFE